MAWLPDAVYQHAAPIGGLSIVLGGVVLAYWVHSRRGSPRAKEWPSTTAVVTESVVGQEGDRPTLEYEYEVDGQVYRNDSAWASGDTMRHERLRSLVESTPVGTEVTIYYDPDHPSASVMVEHSSRRAGVLVAGVALVLLGVVLVALQVT